MVAYGKEPWDNKYWKP